MDAVSMKYNDFADYDDKAEGIFLEGAIIYMLLNEIPDSYEPRDKPLAMAVGSGNFVKEGNIIRVFHEEKYGITPYVASCNPMQLILGADESYDLSIHGSEAGDATKNIPWLAGIHLSKIGHLVGDENKTEGRDYDFIHVNFPDIYEDVWKNVFKQAHPNLAEKGVITTVVHNEDLSDLERFVNNIDIPLVSIKQYECEVGRKRNDYTPKQAWGIAVFKK